MCWDGSFQDEDEDEAEPKKPALQALLNDCVPDFGNSSHDRDLYRPDEEVAGPKRADRS